MKFKVKDRVKAIKSFEERFEIVNQVGTIISANDQYGRYARYLVRFDKNIHGHGDGLRNWNIDEECLVLADGKRDFSHIKQYGIVKWTQKYY